MAKRIPVEVSTTNKQLKGDDGKDLVIEVKCTAEVPETLQEAAEFYGSEEKLLTSVQQDVARRKMNAARPLLRDATEKGDFTSIAQTAIDDYTPGRKPGFGSVAVSEEALSGATDMESLVAILKAAGVKITTGGTPTEEETGEVEGAEEEVQVG